VPHGELATGLEGTLAVGMRYHAFDDCTWRSWKCAAMVAPPPSLESLNPKTLAHGSPAPKPPTHARKPQERVCLAPARCCLTRPWSLQGHAPLKLCGCWVYLVPRHSWALGAPGKPRDCWAFGKPRLLGLSSHPEKPRGCWVQEPDAPSIDAPKPRDRCGTLAAKACQNFDQACASLIPCPDFHPSLK
jgi:hypothetical protein